MGNSGRSMIRVKEKVVELLLIPFLNKHETIVDLHAHSIYSHPSTLTSQRQPNMAVTTDQRSNILLDILTIQPSSLSFAFCSTIILLLAARLFRSVRKGYHEFLSLGQGGVPSTFPNYLRVSYFRLFAITDVFQPPPSRNPTIHPPPTCTRSPNAPPHAPASRASCPTAR